MCTTPTSHTSGLSGARNARAETSSVTWFPFKLSVTRTYLGASAAGWPPWALATVAAAASTPTNASGTLSAFNRMEQSIPDPQHSVPLIPNNAGMSSATPAGTTSPQRLTGVATPAPAPAPVEAAVSPDAAEIRQFLARYHAICPYCRYPLHALGGDRCPECGGLVALGIVQTAYDPGARLLFYLPFATATVLGVTGAL